MQNGNLRAWGNAPVCSLFHLPQPGKCCPDAAIHLSWVCMFHHRETELTPALLKGSILCIAISTEHTDHMWCQPVGGRQEHTPQPWHLGEPEVWRKSAGERQQGRLIAFISCMWESGNIWPAAVRSRILLSTDLGVICLCCSSVVIPAVNTPLPKEKIW